ncbi:two-component system response regulator RppA [Gloeocapsa sp. PCC 73106]|uniref:two-component system response regulator RppA n=1 Tax=Gloeocapsa sp. PCC 73106 TaxID=102232 RepID=UPI0002AC2BD8|nr:two-component system response regulator RppA [Gloeocapsa sp. PCC 73106]ELR96235.1 response regulator with CheY-like receiver domain and winged-helix DNA-binding domain [Gloeocapsa sp. PCC 73106]
MTRILLVEDEADLGAAIKIVLVEHKYIVDWVQTGIEAWQYLDGSSIYTLGIFDWLLPGMSGIELLQNLRRQHNPLPVLLLTAKDSEVDKITGLDQGADDYLVKPFGMAELLARLRALQRRSPQLGPQQLQLGNLILDYLTYSVFYQQPKGEKVQIALTHKEFQLLEYFMRHPQQILTREQILNQLWEWGAEPMSNVVAAQMRLLRRKLAQYHCDNLIETVYGLGYRLNCS